MAQRLDPGYELYYNEIPQRVLQFQQILHRTHRPIHSTTPLLPLAILLMTVQIVLSMETSLMVPRVPISVKSKRCSKRCDILNTILMDSTIRDLSMQFLRFKSQNRLLLVMMTSELVTMDLSLNLLSRNPIKPISKRKLKSLNSMQNLKLSKPLVILSREKKEKPLKLLSQKFQLSSSIRYILKFVHSRNSSKNMDISTIKIPLFSEL